MKILTQEFNKNGFLVFPSLLSQDECQRYRSMVDDFERSGADTPLKDVRFKELLYHPLFHELAQCLIGKNRYVFHHVNAAAQKSGTQSLGWHHDYERYGVEDRSFVMLHVFLYLNGLNGSIGELLLMPGSHNWIVDRYQYSSYPFDYFEGVEKINALPAGSIVVIHSSLVHARRALPGGEDLPRYFIDLSFCEYGGAWFPYLEKGDWKSMLSELKDYDRAIKGGKLSFMFDSSQFYLNLKDKVINAMHLRPVINMIQTIVRPHRVKRTV